MSEEIKQPDDAKNDAKVALSHRLESIGWALFIIMIGCLWLVPADRIPEGAWLIGTGIIMIGVNLARYMNNIKMNGFTLAVGVIAIGLGLAGIFGLELPFFAILLIIIGANIILRLVTDRSSQKS